MTTLLPPGWPRPKGYSNGVVADGRLVFVAGQGGWNANQQFESDDFVAQAEQALANIVAVLAEARAGPEHIVRLTWYVTDKQEYLTRLSDVGRAYRRVIGRHFPTMTLLQVAGLAQVASMPRGGSPSPVGSS